MKFKVYMGNTLFLQMDKQVHDILIKSTAFKNILSLFSLISSANFAVSASQQYFFRPGPYLGHSACVPPDQTFCVRSGSKRITDLYGFLSFEAISAIFQVLATLRSIRATQTPCRTYPVEVPNVVT